MRKAKTAEDEKLGPLLPHLRQHWLAFLLIGFMTAVTAALSACGPVIASSLIDSLVNDRREAFRHYLVLSAMLFGAELALASARQMVGSLTAQRIARKLRLAVFDAFVGLSPCERIEVGDAVSTVSTDVERVVGLVGGTLIGLVTTAVNLTGTVGGMLYLESHLLLIALGSVPPLVATYLAFQSRTQLLSVRERDAWGGVANVAQDMLSKRPELYGCNAWPYARRRFSSAVTLLFQRSLATAYVGMASGACFQGISAAANLLVWAYGGLGVISGRITLGTLVAFLMYYPRLVGGVSALLGLCLAWRAGAGSVRKVVAALCRDHKACPSAEGKTIVRDVIVAKGETVVLRRVSLELRPGDFLVVQGNTGAGKSTIAELLAGVLKPDAGVVEPGWLGSASGGRSAPTRLADLVWVPQGCRLFNTSIRENLALGEELPDAELWRALAMVGMEERVRNLPNQLEELVGEEGIHLSGGECQRLVLARVFLTRPKVVLLDESVSSLPVEDAQLLLARVCDHVISRCGGAVMLITHRTEEAPDRPERRVIDMAEINAETAKAGLERWSA